MEYQEFTRIVGGLLKVVVISMVIERALAFIFEHKWFDGVFNKDITDPTDASKTIRGSKIPGLKGLLALGIAIAICQINKFDVLAAIFNQPGPDQFGIIITSFVVAGGSAGAIAIFQGFLNLGKESRDALIEARQAEAEAAKKIAELEAAQAKANKEKAELEKDEAEARKRLVETEATMKAAEAEAAKEIAELEATQAKANKEKAEFEKDEAEARKRFVQTEARMKAAEAKAAGVPDQ